MDSETALTTPTTAFVIDWTRLACRLSPAIQSIRRPVRVAVITFRFMPDDDDLLGAELPAFNEGISQCWLFSPAQLNLGILIPTSQRDHPRPLLRLREQACIRLRSRLISPVRSKQSICLSIGGNEP